MKSKLFFDHVTKGVKPVVQSSNLLSAITLEFQMGKIFRNFFYKEIDHEEHAGAQIRSLLKIFSKTTHLGLTYNNIKTPGGN